MYQKKKKNPQTLYPFLAWVLQLCDRHQSIVYGRDSACWKKLTQAGRRAIDLGAPMRE